MKATIFYHVRESLKTAWIGYRLVYPSKSVPKLFVIQELMSAIGEILAALEPQIDNLSLNAPHSANIAQCLLRPQSARIFMAKVI